MELLARVANPLVVVALICAAAAGGLVHLKTAGTSYLEALRVFAARAPALFRAIAALAYAHYAEDRATYHVSAELSDWVNLAGLRDADLPALLENNPVREMLHVEASLEEDQPGPDRFRIFGDERALLGDGPRCGHGERRRDERGADRILQQLPHGQLNRRARRAHRRSSSGTAPSGSAASGSSGSG